MHNDAVKRRAKGGRILPVLLQPLVIFYSFCNDSSYRISLTRKSRTDISI